MDDTWSGTPVFLLVLSGIGGRRAGSFLFAYFLSLQVVGKYIYIYFCLEASGPPFGSFVSTEVFVVVKDGEQRGLVGSSSPATTRVVHGGTSHIVSVCLD